MIGPTCVICEYENYADPNPKRARVTTGSFRKPFCLHHDKVYGDRYVNGELNWPKWVQWLVNKEAHRYHGTAQENRETSESQFGNPDSRPYLDTFEADSPVDMTGLAQLLDGMPLAEAALMAGRHLGYNNEQTCEQLGLSVNEGITLAKHAKESLAIKSIGEAKWVIKIESTSSYPQVQ